MSELTLANTQRLDQIGNQIRAGLTFDPKYGISEHETLGNCYEFAVQTHGLIKEEMSHDLIGYAFDHAFNIGVDGGGKLYLASSDVPNLTAHESDDTAISEVIGREHIGRVRSGTVSSAIACSLSMPAISACLSLDDMHAIDNTRQWFTKHWLKAVRLNATLMEVGYAKDALPNYHGLRRGLYKNDFEVIRDSLERLRIRTPQAETRPDYNAELGSFKTNIRRLARTGIANAHDLNSLVEAYSEVLPEKNSSANVVFGDCYRSIAQITDCRTAMEKARELYSRAGKYARSRGGRTLVQNKASKLDNFSITS